MGLRKEKTPSVSDIVKIITNQELQSIEEARVFVEKNTHDARLLKKRRRAIRGLKDTDQVAQEVTDGENKKLKKIKEKMAAVRDGQFINTEKKEKRYFFIQSENPVLLDEQKGKQREEKNQSGDRPKPKSFEFVALNLLIAKRGKQEPLSEAINSLHSKVSKNKSLKTRFFDIVKKIFDAADDIPGLLGNVLKSFGELLEYIGALCLGGLALPVHVYEGYRGICRFISLMWGKKKEAWKEKLKVNAKTQRRTRLLVAGLTGPLALIGAGVAITLIIATALALAGLAPAALVTVATILPPFLPGVLLVIYGITLWRRAYTLRQIRTEVKTFMDNYNDATSDYGKTRNRVQELKNEIEKLQEQKNSLLASVKLGEGVEDTLEARYQALSQENDEQFNQYITFTLDQQTRTQELAALLPTYEKHLQEYEDKRDWQLIQEAKVGFKAVEIFFLSFVAISMSLGVAIGLGVVTFGGATLPVLLTILAVGVSGGLSLKIFEGIDEKKNGAATRWIREHSIDLFHRLWDRIRTKKEDAHVIEAEEGSNHEKRNSHSQSEKKEVNASELKWLGVKEQQRSAAPPPNTKRFWMFNKPAANEGKIPAPASLENKNGK